MNNALVQAVADRMATTDDDIMGDETLWDIVASGDLKGLSPSQRARYFLYRCRQEGLNPASQPFTYLTLNGKGVLYGNKTAADQLRKLHGISIANVECTDDGEYITYEVTVKDRDGREDFEIGSVFVGSAKGVERANAKMKALTKAKRRATYSICGTGVLDETEVETIVGNKVYDGVNQFESAMAQVVDVQTGEIGAAPPLNLDDDIRRLRGELGWKANDVIDEARKANPVINLRTREGKQLMVDLLQSYVDAVNSDHDDGPEQDSFIDAESRVAGEPGYDQHTA